MPRIQTSTIALDSIQLGDGPDLVLSHGLAANQAFWYFRIAPAFAREFRVTLYDLRGHGNSELPPTGYRTRDLAEDLRALMDAREIETADLVGHSFGGAVSLHFAVLYPDRVRSLTIIDARLHALQPFNSDEDRPYWDEQRDRLHARGLRAPPGTPRWLMPMLEELESSQADPRSPGMPPGLPAGNELWDPNRRSARRWLKLVRETSFLDDLRDTAGLTADAIASLEVPVLLLYGDQSLLLKSFQELSRLLPHAQTRILKNAGHFFALVRPDCVVEAVLPFLRDPGGRPHP